MSTKTEIFVLIMVQRYLSETLAFSIFLLNIYVNLKFKSNAAGTSFTQCCSNEFKETGCLSRKNHVNCRVANRQVAIPTFAQDDSATPRVL